MKPITVLIVDDSAVIRRLFRELLEGIPDIKVLDTAKDAMDAREKIKQLNPDVLTLDIEMPGMDGISFLEKIMALRPMPVIMVSTLTQKGAAVTVRALAAGAVDYIAKPMGTVQADALEAFRLELTSKIRTAAGANLIARRVSAPLVSGHVVSFNPSAKPERQLIAIGSSTGGVEALRDLFTVMPANVPPIVMTQHMPEQFTPSFAARLDSLSQVSVKEAAEGDVLMPGHAYLAPGNQHLTVKKAGSRLICHLDGNAAVSGHRPSVDVLFHSVAETVGASAVGVILTGMGKDGADGMLEMRKKGAYTIGQNQSSCVVYGMPKAANAAGAVVTELPLHGIVAHALSQCE